MTRASILPTASRSERILRNLLAAFFLLASLGAILGLAADRAAAGWNNALLETATVIVYPRTDESPDAAAIRATETLASIPGVTQAAMLERQEAEALLRPWLGADLPKDLPIPRLVAVELNLAAPATSQDLEAALTKAGITAVVDDHAAWTRQITQTGVKVRLAMLVIGAALLALALTTAVWAAHGAMETCHKTIGALHALGAEDRFIIGLFWRRTTAATLVASTAGAGAAILIGTVLRLMGGERGLTPIAPVAWIDLTSPVAFVLLSVAVSAWTARVLVLKMLRSAS